MRFISQDPYRGTQTDRNTWHLYAYVHGNPINYTDPTGHWSRAVHENMTKLAISRIGGISSYARSELLRGSSFPDNEKARVKSDRLRYNNPNLPMSIYGKNAYHGNINKYKKAVDKEIKNAKSKGSFFHIGIALHAIQDFYAHNVMHGGSYKRVKGEYDKGRGGRKNKYITDEYYRKYKAGTGKTSKNRKNHLITADCVNADFKGGKWVWVNQYDNKRFTNALGDSATLIKYFANRMG